MGKKKKERLSPKAPWLSVSLKDMSHARTCIDEYVHVKGERHPLEEVAEFVSGMLIAIECDCVPIPDMAYNLDGDPPEFTVTFVKENRRLFCRFLSTAGFSCERSVMQEGVEGQSWAVSDHEEITRETVGRFRVVDEFRRVVRWLVYNDQEDGQ
jgi:hypothetical protein